MRAGSAHRPGRRRNRAALLVLACGLAGCGGGGGTGKAWSVPERISFANGNVGAPEIAVDTSGIATAAYQDHDGTDWVIAASRYTPGNSWGSPQGISTTPSTSAIGNDVDVAAGPTGEAVVVWTQKPDSLTFDSAWANSWTPGGGWGMPQLLDSTARLVDAPRVALDASGAGTAVWVEAAPVPDTDDILRGRPYAPGAGWGSQFSIPLMQPTRIQSPPVIAAQPDGRTYVAWSQTFNSGISLFASWSDDQPPIFNVTVAPSPASIAICAAFGSSR